MTEDRHSMSGIAVACDSAMGGYAGPKFVKTSAELPEEMISGANQ